MPRLCSRLRSESGQALMISFFILLAVLAFGGAAFEASVVLSTSTNRETNAQKAFQAADSGIDAAIHRLALLGPDPTGCIGTSSPLLVGSCPSGWGPASPSEAVSYDSSFTYRVSTQNPAPTCVGTPTSSTGDRCIVSTGTANGVTRRLMARVTTKGGANYNVFASSLSPGGAQAADAVKLESTVNVTSNVSLNNKLDVATGSTITGTVTVGPKAKVHGWSTYSCAPSTPAATPPNCTVAPVSIPNADFATTSTAFNDPANLGGNNNSKIPTAYYTDTQNNKVVRSLHVPKNKQVTLAPGTYNFCSIKIDGRGILNAGGTVNPDGTVNPVRIYLDSPYRNVGQASNCPKNSGTFTAGGKAVIVNPSLDPRALEIYAWGSQTRKHRSRLQFPLGKNSFLAAIIYAPQSEVRFGDGKGVLDGAIAGQRVVFKKGMRFISDSRATTQSSWSTSTIVQSFRVAWKQCSSTAPASGLPPSTGC